MITDPNIELEKITLPNGKIFYGHKDIKLLLTILSRYRYNQDFEDILQYCWIYTERYKHSYNKEKGNWSLFLKWISRKAIRQYRMKQPFPVSISAYGLKQMDSGEINKIETLPFDCTKKTFKPNDWYTLNQHNDFYEQEIITLIKRKLNSIARRNPGQMDKTRYKKAVKTYKAYMFYNKSMKDIAKEENKTVQAISLRIRLITSMLKEELKDEIELYHEAILC